MTSHESFSSRTGGEGSEHPEASGNEKKILRARKKRVTLKREELGVEETPDAANNVETTTEVDYEVKSNEVANQVARVLNVLSRLNPGSKSVEEFEDEVSGIAEAAKRTLETAENKDAILKEIELHVSTAQEATARAKDADETIEKKLQLLKAHAVLIERDYDMTLRDSTLAGIEHTALKSREAAFKYFREIEGEKDNAIKSVVKKNLRAPAPTGGFMGFFKKAVEPTIPANIPEYLEQNPHIKALVEADPTVARLAARVLNEEGVFNQKQADYLALRELIESYKTGFDTLEREIGNAEYSIDRLYKEIGYSIKQYS